VSDYEHLTKCLACGGDELVPFFEMADQPLANDFRPAGAVLARYPLALNVCPVCWHVQQSVAVSPDLMFKNYAYVSGTSETLRSYFRWFASKVYEDFGGRPLRVLDIASNDGSLLAEFARRGDMVLGVDPAENLAHHSKAAGVTTLVGYWDDVTCAALESAGEPFDVIVAQNVLGHVADPVEFLRLCKRVLAPGGRIYVQTSQARMIERGEFDTAYAEHLSFFSMKSFRAAADRAGLRIVADMHVPVHGTSYLIEMEPQTKPAHKHASSGIYATEMRRGQYRLTTYRAFKARVDDVRREALSVVECHRGRGFRIAGYGAAAKGVVCVNHFGLDMAWVADDNPLKVGSVLPGTNIPVVSGTGMSAAPTLWVILGWNFRTEIINRIKRARPGYGDKFLTVFPELRVSE